MVLKKGCRVEALQLSTVERVVRALALFPVVARRVARLMRLDSNLPNLDSGLLFETDEWQAAYILAKKTCVANRTEAQRGVGHSGKSRGIPRPQATESPA